MLRSRSQTQHVHGARITAAIQASRLAAAARIGSTWLQRPRLGILRRWTLRQTLGRAVSHAIRPPISKRRKALAVCLIRVGQDWSYSCIQNWGHGGRATWGFGGPPHMLALGFHFVILRVQPCGASAPLSSVLCPFALKRRLISLSLNQIFLHTKTIVESR